MLARSASSIYMTLAVWVTTIVSFRFDYEYEYDFEICVCTRHIVSSSRTDVIKS